MFTGILHSHVLLAVLFILIHGIKVVLMMMNKERALEKINSKTKIPHMIIGTLFLLTGIYLWINSGTIETGNWFYTKLALFLIAVPLSVVGLKKKNKGFSLVSFMMFIYIYGISETKSADFKKAEPTAVTLANGKAIFQNYCMNCHGKDGTMGLSGAANLKESQMHLEQIKEIIKKGKNAMLSYENTLTEEQIQLVSEYVQHLNTAQ